MSNLPSAKNPFAVHSLQTTFGGHLHPSPLRSFYPTEYFVSDIEDGVIEDVTLKSWCKFHGSRLRPLMFEMAGPREQIFWNPENTNVAIVTCGGLAPGLNNVLQSLVTLMFERYGIKNIYGVPFGYYGFEHDPTTQNFKFGWSRLDPLSVQNIDRDAGSLLGTSRGHSNVTMIVDALSVRNIQVLFTIGGDGTLRGANAIYEEIQRRNLAVSVVGIPKTIDNDIPWVSKSFGFDTAVEKAVEALRSAQAEARSALNGIGLVKIMGRNSGMLTATAAAALNDIDCVLVPEVELHLHGQKGFFAYLKDRIQHKGHATIALAEGAGQALFSTHVKSSDDSGNILLDDIGLLLKQSIPGFFKNSGLNCTLKYIEPSYLLRAQTTTASDALFCTALGRNAVHAAMAGKTGLMIGHVHGEFTHVPLSALVSKQKILDLHSSLWLSVLSSTGQPAQWK